MANEARLNEILDIAEQAKAEGDEKTFAEMMALYDQESAAGPARSALASAAPPKPTAPPEPQMSNNPLGVLGGGLDAAATLVSGAFATPIAGLVGLGAAGLDQIPGVDIDAAGVIDATQSLLTHDPMSETGKAIIGTVAAPFEKLAQGAQYVGDKTLDATGSPLLATAAHTLIEGAPEILGLKGARAAGAATKAARRVAPTADARLLQNAGVDLKRSDMGGNRWKDIDRVTEDVLGNSSMDVRQAQQFNRAVLDRADPQGQVTSGKVKVSEDVLRDLRNDVSKAYDDLHSRRETPIDQQVDAQLDALLLDAEVNLDPMQFARIEKQVANIRNKASIQGGALPGKTGQVIRTNLGKLKTVNDPFVRDYAGQLQDILDDAWERAAPMADRVKMAETRARFRMNLQLEKTMQGNATGNVSPAKLYSIADKPTNRSAGLHDLAAAGRNVLVDSLANSGTAPRAANIGKMVGMMNKPGELARTLAGVAGGRFLNESPNLGVKASAALRQPATQLTLAGGAGEAALDAEMRAQEEFLRALGL